VWRKSTTAAPYHTITVDTVAIAAAVWVVVGAISVGVAVAAAAVVRVCRW
jgi:hypothetical protein